MEGNPITGVAISIIQGNGGVVGVVFDRSEILPNTINKLMTTLKKVTTFANASPHKPKKINWYTAYFPDGSGTIRLPKGWRITSSYQGGVDVAGLEGEKMSLGIGLPNRVLSLIDCSPAMSGYWVFYYPTVTAPAQQFAVKLPVMMQAWAGWNINPKVFQQRLNRALNSMKQTHRLLNEANQYRQRTFDNTLSDWTEVFRGSRIVRDTRTGEERNTNIGWVDQTVQQLNERAGYNRFEQIPLREFNTR